MAARRALVPLWLILTSFTFTNGVSETNQIFNNEVVSEARPSFDIGEEPSSSISDEQLQNHMEDLGISSHLRHHEAENSENHAPKPYESGSMPASSTDQQNGPDPNSVQMVLLTCGTRSCDKDDFSRGNDDEPTLGDIFRNLQKKFSGISEDEVSKKLEELLPISVVERARRMGGRRMAIPFTFAPLEWLGGLWSAAEFEVDRLPPALHPALALARRPARLGALYAWWYDTALIPGLVFTLQFLPRLAKTLAVQLLEVMPDPDEMIKPVITYPCDAERSKGLFYWLFPEEAGRCECVGQRCWVRAPPSRGPCLYLDAPGLGAEAARGAFPAAHARALRMSRWTEGEAGPSSSYLLAGLAKPVRRWLPGAVPTHPARLLGAAALRALARPLAGCRPLHYLLGALFGLLVLLALVAYSAAKTLRHSVPGGSYLTDLGLVPLAAVGSLGAAGAWASRTLWGGLLGAAAAGAGAFWEGGALGRPHLGKICFGGVVAISMLLTRYMGWFSQEPSSESMNWTNGQANLARLIMLGSISLGMTCTSDLETSIVLVLMLLYFEYIQYYRWRMYMWQNQSTHAAYKYMNGGKGLGAAAYEAQGRAATAAALRRLRAHLRANPQEAAKLDHYEETRRFMDGGEHYLSHEGIDGEDSEKLSRSCVIQ